MPRITKEKAVLRAPPKFREETSKKADSAVKDRIAATHNLGQHGCPCKPFFRPAQNSGGQMCDSAIPAGLDVPSLGRGQRPATQAGRLLLAANLVPGAISDGPALQHRIVRRALIWLSQPRRYGAPATHVRAVVHRVVLASYRDALGA